MLIVNTVEKVNWVPKSAFVTNKTTRKENKEAQLLQTVKGNSLTQYMINLQHHLPQHVIGVECLAELFLKGILHANRNMQWPVIAETYRRNLQNL